MWELLANNAKGRAADEALDVVQGTECTDSVRYSPEGHLRFEGLDCAGNVTKNWLDYLRRGFLLWLDCSLCRQPSTQGRNFGNDRRRFGSDRWNRASGLRNLARVLRHVSDFQARARCGSVIPQLNQQSLVIAVGAAVAG